MRSSDSFAQSQTPRRVELPEGTFYLFQEIEVRKIGLALADRAALQEASILKDTIIASKDENLRLLSETLKAREQTISAEQRIAQLERESRVRAEEYASKLEAQIKEDRKIIVRSKWRKVFDAGKGVGLFAAGALIGGLVK